MFTSRRNRQKSAATLARGGKDLSPAVRRRPPSRNLRLGLEQLEERCLMSTVRTLVYNE